MKHSFLRSILASLIACIPLCAGLSDGLVGFWKFDGSDGKTVKDLSPKMNDGIITDGAIAQEKGTSSLVLNGMDTSVTVNERTAFGIKDRCTVSVWARFADMQRYSLIVGRPHTNGGWTTPMFGMYTAYMKAVFGVAKKDKLLLDSGDEIPLGTWAHLTAVYDGSKAVFYVNGIKKNENAASGDIGNNGQPFYIGQPVWRSSPPMNGRIGEVRIYDRALSGTEVNALYGETKNGYDLAVAAQKNKFIDGTIIVESPGNTPGNSWQKYSTRTLNLLSGYAPKADTVHVDSYGGWTDSPREKATGFFRTQMIGDRCWLINPDGYRYIHIGMDQVTPLKHFENALTAKFGTKKRWAEETSRLFFENGFNGKNSRGLSDIQLLRAVSRPLPYTVLMSFISSFARTKKLTYPTAGHTGFSNDCIPVFHPDFERHCDAHAAPFSNTANDPYLLGIFSDNELQCPVDLLDRHLMLDAGHPDLRYGREAAHAWMEEHLGHRDITRCTRRTRLEFIAFVFGRYYRIVRAAIKKYDTNHLFIGTRICYATQFENPYFMTMCGKFIDVITVNYYGVWGPDHDQLKRWHAWSGKPVLFSEWYSKAEDTGLANTHGAGWLVRTQKDRAAYYQHTVMGYLEAKSCVGWHLFKYQDDPKESVALDAAGGANKGLFGTNYEPHQPFLDYARAVNREAYPLTEFFDNRK